MLGPQWSSGRKAVRDWRLQAPSWTAARKLNRQSCNRDYSSRKERADAAEHQNIVNFDHGISTCDGGRDGGAKAAFLQPFVGDGVRPVLRRKIKSNQIR
jgi:hypothetical protein